MISATFKILVGDAIEQLKTLPDNSIHTAVTSPPYWRLRNYGIDGQIGHESTLNGYIDALVAVFREVRRVLRPDGTFWLNIGDTYNGSGRGPDKKKAVKGWDVKDMLPTRIPDVKRKDLIGIPWTMAFALRNDGWWLRSDIIWHKRNPLCEPVKDRPSHAHEYMFLLTKSEKYFYDYVAVREKAVGGVQKRDATGIPEGSWDEERGIQRHRACKTAGCKDGMRNLRTVWSICAQPLKAKHFAAFPEALVEPCIKAGSSEYGCCSKCGEPYKRMTKSVRVATRPALNTKTTDVSEDEMGHRDPERHITQLETTGWSIDCDCNAERVPCTVLDPFCGSGRTLITALKLNRNGLGIELNPEYAKMANKLVKAVASHY